MTRPDFSSQLSVHEFKQYYWYKTELQAICREYHLPVYGTKYELMEYICAFLGGRPASAVHPKRPRNKKSTLKASEITPDTKVLTSGFRFNQEARRFFAAYFGVAKFSFRKTMASKLREIEEKHDTAATVADLIAAYKQTEPAAKTGEEATYQWNNFVRDFHQDPISRQFNSPLKVAALLWR
ncbi:hypothetical protein EQ500_03275, partial [Lactobacillus sp. XV13L]|nr:hypothetical protein [Lactobacillus sp. XV13L]